MHTAISKPTPLTKRGSSTSDEIGSHIFSRFKELKAKRAKIEAKWDTTYSMYRANPDDMRAVAKASFSTGSKREWKHRINTGKTFEVVEVLVAYFKGATFPSDDWFNAEGLEPNLADAARLVKHLAKFKMEEALVRDKYDEWLRNLVIFGFSVFRVGWTTDVEQKTYRSFSEGGMSDDTRNVECSKLCLESVSPYDVWFDGHDSTFCQLRLTKSELAYQVEEGYYHLDSELLDVYPEGDDQKDKQPEIIEFYGPVILGGARYQCVHAVFFNNTLIRLADSSYWVYIVHLPLVMVGQILVVNETWPWFVKFGAVVGGTMAVSLLTYELLVRHSFVGGWLNGRRIPWRRRAEPELSPAE